ncbi:MAG: murein peptide amidase A [Halobacteriovoraceae bacterium]|jgi:murein peptide amidase A|nr:murein peptide amidase A [Halobacteriovoraceae bacterium]
MIFTPLSPGTSVEGLEIEALKTDIQTNKYLYLLAGTHGDEVEGVYVLQQLLSWLKEEHSIEELPIVVVPILNPDGYRSGSRVNSHAVDLNRNYPTENWSSEFKKEKYNPGSAPLSEPENEFLDKLFKKFPPGFIISFHSWKPIINFNDDAEDVAEYLSSYNEYPITEDIGYPTPGSLGSYAPEKFNAPVITFECPVLNEDISLKSIWECNEKGLKNLIQSELLKDKLK